MKFTVHHIAAAGAACLSLGLAASALAQPPHPAGPEGRPQAQGPFGPRGPGAADRQAMFADMRKQREQRLHDLLQIKPDQDGAFRTFLAALEQARPQRAPEGRRGQSGRPAQASEREHPTTPERLDRMAQRMAERQQRAQKTAAAVKTFYAVLSPEQRKAFDELPVMRIGEGHGPGRRWGGRMMRGAFQGPPPGPAR